MKCLSLMQPWATLVILGVKRCETRRWRTDHRGPTIVRNSVPVAHLVLPNEVARYLVEILMQAIQETEAVARSGNRISLIPPRPENH